MLARSQVAALAQQGRELAEAIELCVATREQLVQREAEAFSAADNGRLQQLRQEIHTVQEETFQRRSDLVQILQELSDHAKTCLSDLRYEASRSSVPADLPTLPERAGPDRIEDTRRYFEEINKIVGTATSRLTDLRREQFLLRSPNCASS